MRKQRLTQVKTIKIKSGCDAMVDVFALEAKSWRFESSHPHHIKAYFRLDYPREIVIWVGRQVLILVETKIQSTFQYGDVAQLVVRLLHTEMVTGSSPVITTTK